VCVEHHQSLVTVPSLPPSLLQLRFLEMAVRRTARDGVGAISAIPRTDPKDTGSPGPFRTRGFPHTFQKAFSGLGKRPRRSVIGQRLRALRIGCRGCRGEDRVGIACCCLCVGKGVTRRRSSQDIS